MECLFSYGTLQKKEVQLRLFGRILEAEADHLVGYKKSVIEITDEIFLSGGEDKMQQMLTETNKEFDSVEGMALALTEGELLLADRYEPSNYTRKEVQLASGKKAWVYIRK
jgi:hypothetical protein